MVRQLLENDVTIKNNQIYSIKHTMFDFTWWQGCTHNYSGSDVGVLFMMNFYSQTPALRLSIHFNAPRYRSAPNTSVGAFAFSAWY